MALPTPRERVMIAWVLAVLLLAERLLAEVEVEREFERVQRAVPRATAVQHPQPLQPVLEN